MNNIKIKSSTLFEKIADFLMVPIMYLVSGTTESPQKTHIWNIIKLQPKQIEGLNHDSMIKCKGISDSVPRFKYNFPIFHVPILGGCRHYVVVQPSNYDYSWHIGWLAKDNNDISKIKINGPVRMVLGKDEVSFFGVDSNEYKQIELIKIGEGKIGDNGPFKNVPLL